MANCVDDRINGLGEISLLPRRKTILESSLRGLHPESITEPEEIRRVLERAAAARVRLYRGLNSEIDLEMALIELVTDRSIVLRTINFNDQANAGQIFLRFDHEDRPYFFATRRIAMSDKNGLVVRLPNAMFYRERRDRSRKAPDSSLGDPRRVELAGLMNGSCEGEIKDKSPSGLGVLVSTKEPIRKKTVLRVRYLDGRERGSSANYQVRSARPASGLSGWTRIGLVRADVSRRRLIDVEYRERFEPGDLVDMEPAAARLPESLIDKLDVRQISVRAPNGDSEELVYLVDGWGRPAGATAVVISNGWGQTKEALLPLARTLVETFRAHGLPIEVIRYDGIRKRGESFTDPECQIPGGETENYVFSQGVRDIETIVRHLREAPEHGASRVILVSFSASAIEARKAVACDRGQNIDGWISVVGSPDLQSMARSISGGVDFVGGHERGISFGVQELLGVRVNIDRMAVDALRHGMSFIEDSRRDLELIQVPITWFHGRYDAWVDLGRVRDVMSHGDTRRRRLIVLSTGHQIKTSKQADLTFRMIAREVGIMAQARNLEAISPSAGIVRRLRLAEDRRLHRTETDLRSFWRDYLIGRDRSVGIELLTAGSAYQLMMANQIAALDIRPGSRIADLGSGTGAFPLALARDPRTPRGVEVVALDYVSEALGRTRLRLDGACGGQSIKLWPIESNLDVDRTNQRVPLADHSVDGVIASLFISYLENPDLLLAEVFRILRPGGRLVISSLCRDADIGRLYVESFAELQAVGGDAEIPELRRSDLGTVSRNFLNDAARILELEDRGAFRFMDPDELSNLVIGAGFEHPTVTRSLGSPAQAIVVSACRPRLRSMAAEARRHARESNYNHAF